MGSETPTKKLYEFAAKGNAEELEKVVGEDGLFFKKVSSSAYSGKTPLHIAAAEGYAKMASLLLREAPKMCWSRDFSGMNPIHVAAMHGRVDVLEKLLESDKLERFAAMEKLDRGQTVMHLCVRHGQLMALKLLVVKLGEFVLLTDDHGDSVLHLAVRLRNVEITLYLVANTKIDKTSKNFKGQTPMDILKQSISYDGLGSLDNNRKQIEVLLSPNNSSSSNITHFSQSHTVEFITKKREAIMVVATLIAAMAFQAAVNPTGGVWQSDTEQHRAGEAVMAFKDPKIYKNFIRSNTVAFVTSLSTILLLIIGLPFKYRAFMWALVVIMWVSVTAVGVTYGASIMVATPKVHKKSLSHVIEIAIFSWIALMLTLLVAKISRLLHRWSHAHFSIKYCSTKFGCGEEP